MLAHTAAWFLHTSILGNHFYRFAVRAEGFVIVRPAPQGALAMGPLKEEAKVQLELSMSTALDPEPQVLTINFGSIEAAQEERIELAGNQHMWELSKCVISPH